MISSVEDWQNDIRREITKEVLEDEKKELEKK